MRRSAVVLSFSVAIASLLPLAPARAATSDIVQQLDQLIESFPGGAGVWIADPSIPRSLYAHEPDAVVLPASLYKLALLMEAERRVEAGQLRYDDLVTIEYEDITLDGSFEAAGTELTVDEALETMITISDNGTAMAFWRMLGADNVNATLAHVGVSDFHVFTNLYEDNVATPRSVGTLLTLLAQRQLISPAASDRMIARLGRQQISDRLPAGLPPHVVVAHKTGNLPGLVHDAGIIYTPFGPRVVVAMTWDAHESDAYAFISSVGSIVYSTVLEPPANARYEVPRTALSVDAGSHLSVPIAITNVGNESWSGGGARSVALIWEMRDQFNALVGSSEGSIPIPDLAVGQGAILDVLLIAPRRPGDYAITLGLVDSAGRALASVGAATATFQINAHLPYLVSSDIRIPSILHRGEASLIEARYTALPAAGTTTHDVELAWRLHDAAGRRTVREGATRIGTIWPSTSGVFYAPLIAPPVLGSYRLSYELRESDVAVSETVTQEVYIVGPRTWPGDESRAGVSSAPRSSPGPSRTPRASRAPPSAVPQATSAPSPMQQASPAPATMPRASSAPSAKPQASPAPSPGPQSSPAPSPTPAQGLPLPSGLVPSPQPPVLPTPRL